MLKELYSEAEHAEDVEVDSTQIDSAEEADGSANDSDSKEETVYTEPQVTAKLDGKNIILTISGATFTKERVIALDDEILESIAAEFSR